MILRTSLMLAAAGIVVSCMMGRQAGTIAVNRLGYRPGDPKTAFVRERAAALFELREAASDSVVLRGAVPSTGRHDASTGDDLFSLSFDAFDVPGVYRIVIPGSPVRSEAFRLAHDVYAEPAVRALRSFFFQRCGTALAAGTPWDHPPCHRRAISLYPDTASTMEAHGGWHDAGDYNRFTVTTAVSVAYLLRLHEHRPELFADGSCTIPESGNGMPDILDEARWGLEWILRMQDSGGGVFHKVSIAQWTGEHLPHEETDRLYLFPVSSAATGSAAAAAAMGSRLFRKRDPAFAHRLLGFAERAWEYLARNPGIVPPGGFRNPPGVAGGEYEDLHDDDERFWAAVELFRLTGREPYHVYIRREYAATASGYRGPPGWQNVAGFALSSYLAAPGADPEIRRTIVTRLSEYADVLVERVESAGYRCVLSGEEFYWGSNSVALGYAFDLIQAHRATGRESYSRAALDQLHYVLGRNALDVVFLTGGEDGWVMRPYHQLSMLTGVGPVPGMLVGGPNVGSRLNERSLSAYPGRSYEDDEKNYFVNETAINYTAGIVYLAGYFDGTPAAAAARSGPPEAGR